jgi:hypothetical protein
MYERDAASELRGRESLVALLVVAQQLAVRQVEVGLASVLMRENGARILLGPRAISVGPDTTETSSAE